MIYKLKIQIQGITKPPVWRRILIPGDASFEDLHEVIQAAFGWEGYHLYQFSKKPYDGGWTISDDNEDDPFGMSAPSIKASDTPIQEYLNSSCPKITYTYDLGDDWIHLITLEDDDVKDCPDPDHAHCIDGKGVAPIEDCGGIYGFMELREYITVHPERALEALAEEDEADGEDEDEAEGSEKKKLDPEEEEMLDTVRWAGNFFDINDKGQPEFTKIDVAAINIIVSQIPLTLIKGKGKKKATSKKSKTSQDQEEFTKAVLDVFREVFGDKIGEGLEDKLGEELGKQFGKRSPKKK